MKVVITQHDQLFDVWAMPDVDQPPTEIADAFVIGSGATAVEALEQAQTRLMSVASEATLLLHDARLGISLGHAIAKVGR
jgi:hypothetical protein